jgi:chromate reductase
MGEIKILGIVGSLRQASYNHAALKAAQGLLPVGAALNLITLNDIPVFNQDIELTPPESVLEFKRQIRAADAILFATPEYNHSFSGGAHGCIHRQHGNGSGAIPPAANPGRSEHARGHPAGSDDHQCRGTVRPGQRADR